MNSGRTRYVTRALTVAIIVLGLALAWSRLWGSVDSPTSYFGGDHVAYREGALRLETTGSPYHPALLAGPIANHVDNVPIGYLYPPVLAQLFVPLGGVPPDLLAWASTVVQAILLLALLPLVYRRFEGELTLDATLLIWMATILSFPAHIAVFGGNLSGWIAIAVAVMLISGGGGAGLAAALITLLKMTPVVLLAPALVYRPTRHAALITVVAVTGASIALSPSAWVSWLIALPNIVRFPTGDAASNLAPAAVLSSYGLGWLGALVGYGVAGVSAVAAAALARRGYWPGAVAAGVAALLFASGSTWDHYLVATLPLVIAAVPNRSLAARAVIGIYVATTTVMWFWFVSPADGLRLAYVTVAIATSIGMVVLLTPKSATLRFGSTSVSPTSV